MAKTVDPYYEWLGIPPKDQPPNHYRLLGVELFEENRNVVDAAANRQMSFIKAYQAGEDSDLSQKLLNELAAARLCLLNPDKKAAYDAQLRSEMASRAAAATPAPADHRLQPLDGSAPPGSPAVSVEPVSRRQGSPPESSERATGPVPVDVKAAPPVVALGRAKAPGRSGNRTWIILAMAAALVAGAAIAVGFVVAPVLFPQSDVPDRMVVQTPEPGAGVRPETPLPPESPETPQPKSPPLEPATEPPPSAPAPEPAEEDEPEPAPPEEPFAAEPHMPENDPPPASRTAESLAEAERRLTAAAEQASSPADYQTVVHEVLALADRAIVDSQNDVAKRLAALALTAARRAELPAQAREATLLLIDLNQPLDDAARERARQRLLERSGKPPAIDRQLPATSRRPAGPQPPPLAIAPFDETAARQHQEAWANYLDVPVVWTNSIDMQFVLIPPGEFDMGSTEAEVAQLLAEAEATNRPRWYTRSLPSEAPKHRVRITKPFYLGVHPVTQAEYERVMQTNPSRFKGNMIRPVESVSWADAVAFYGKLAELPQEQTTRARYRLPTEAEWEYACRAGSTTIYSFGESPQLLGDYAWYTGNSGGTTHPVGQKRPNAFGLYDVHGNVWEWCQDWWAVDYYGASPSEDPQGPATGSERVNRGGSWGDPVSRCRASCRDRVGPGNRGVYLGFRLVSTVSLPP